jgi:hypothetical protein
MLQVLGEKKLSASYNALSVNCYLPLHPSGLKP